MLLLNQLKLTIRQIQTGLSNRDIKLCPKATSFAYESTGLPRAYKYSKNIKSTGLDSVALYQECKSCVSVLINASKAWICMQFTITSFNKCLHFVLLWVWHDKIITNHSLSGRISKKPTIYLAILQQTRLGERYKHALCVECCTLLKCDTVNMQIREITSSALAVFTIGCTQIPGRCRGDYRHCFSCTGQVTKPGEHWTTLKGGQGPAHEWASQLCTQQ